MNKNYNITYEVIKVLERALVVSSQASSGEPLCSCSHICAMALSGLDGGAKGLRLEGVENISFVRKQTQVPIIGLIKSSSVQKSDRLTQVYITSTYEEACAVSDAGADIIALDATARTRPDGLMLSQIIDKIHSQLQKPVWADISSYEEGLAAAGMGADVVSTTLFGYTQETKQTADHGPDFELLALLCENLKVPVVLEGRVWYPEQVQKAFKLGAYAVVVGSAITRPQLITKRFVQAIPR